MSSTTAANSAPASAPTKDAVALCSSTEGDVTYMMNSFSTLLEGDLYDDELNEISNLFAPAVSDDEDSSSSKTSNSPVPSGDLENHPGAQVAVLAAAMDSALQTEGANKRTYHMAMPTTAPAPSAHKRRVTMDGTSKRTGITLSSSCGSLTHLHVANTTVAPECPKSVAAVVIPTAAAAVVPVSAASVATAPAVPVIAAAKPATTTVAVKNAKKTIKASAAASSSSSASNKAATAPTISTRRGMTPAEKAKACRERNREHARKTRLRKKAYVDELKRSLNDMIEQRDAANALEEQKATIVDQNRDVRFQVMQDFLNLRGNNERTPQRWASILVPEEFKLKMPVTDFQTMVSTTDAPAAAGQQILTGVDDVMAEASYFSSFLQTLGANANEAASPVFFVYNCERDSFLMDGSQAIFNFEATSTGAISQGAKAELTLSGTFRATFCAETNRVRSGQMMFDTGAIRCQLQSSY